MRPPAAKASAFIAHSSAINGVTFGPGCQNIPHTRCYQKWAAPRGHRDNPCQPCTKMHRNTKAPIWAKLPLSTYVCASPNLGSLSSHCAHATHSTHDARSLQKYESLKETALDRWSDARPGPSTTSKKLGRYNPSICAQIHWLRRMAIGRAGSRPMGTDGSLFCKKRVATSDSSKRDEANSQLRDRLLFFNFPGVQ